MTRLRDFGLATSVLRYSNWIIAALVTLSATLLNALFFLTAGGLWRDEAAFVRLSLLPSVSEVWKNLPFDHCPILMPLVVRAWSTAGLGNTDLGLRILGLFVGLFLLLAFWFASWTMRNGAPLLAVTLAGLNVTIIRAGDSLRGYGLGSALAVFALALMWRLARAPSLAAFCCAVAVAVLSVQSLYQNAFLLFAACCGGFMLCAVERRWRDTLPIFAVGTAAAVSLLPYIPLIIRAQDWYILNKVGFRLSHAWKVFSVATSSPLTGFAWVWVALWIGALATAICVLFWRRDRLPNQSLILFAATSLVLGATGFAFFLKGADFATQPWYYVPLMAFSAVCLEAIFFTAWRWARSAAMIFAGLTISATFSFELPVVECRQTNMDLVAARLSSEVAPGDYVIVHPWYCGVTFERYYKGTAPWTTLPPLEDHGVHRFDLLKAKIQTKDPIAPVIDRITSTLESGNRVWLVGEMPHSEEPPPKILPAPNNPWGWSADPYSFYWGLQVTQFLSAHCRRGAVVMPPLASCVNPYENLSLVAVAEWKP